MNLALFAPEPLPLAAKLRTKLSGLARDGIFLGGSSWKYEGWLDQIYTREKYLVRGRFSQRRFEDECLAEYATVFPVVCGDFSFYQFPAPAFWQKLFQTAPEPLQFGFKVPEEITVRQWPQHPRYGPRGGTANENFLNADLFATAFARVLEPYPSRVAVLIFEFSPFGRGAFASPAEFLERLAAFLDALPGRFRYAVEIRNAEIVSPEYFALLRAHGVAHVFNAWTRMPTLGEQTSWPDAGTASFTVTRALLRQGRPYERAVEQFAPYTRVQDPNPEGRDAIRALIERSRREKKAAYIFVNNRFEGNAPQTMEAIVDALPD